MAYRKVESRIWSDERFRALSDDAKLIFLMLLTHPHMTSVGAMRATVAGLAEELKWPLERFSNGFDTVLEGGMVRFDKGACMLVLTNFLKHNAPANPNVIKGWVYAIELLPECPLKQEVINGCRTVAERYREGLGEQFGKPFRIQEQEQEQELNPRQPHLLPAVQKQEKEPAIAKGGRRTKLELTELPASWDSWCREHHPNVDPVSQFARFRDHHLSKGSLMADWLAAWRTWCSRSIDFAPRGPASPRDLETRNAATASGWKPPEETF